MNCLVSLPPAPWTYKNRANAGQPFSVAGISTSLYNHAIKLWKARQTMQPSQGKRILPAFFNKAILLILLLSSSLSLTAGSAPAQESNPGLAARGYTVNALETQIVLKGDGILGGHGVDVVYPLQGPADSSGYVPFQYQCTAAGCFQCLEFVLWLYDARLEYPYKWPGAIWNPYQLVGVVQIAGQLAFQVDSGVLPPENAQYLLYKAYSDLSYYPNKSAAPPEPGDILISADGGHAMIVNRVGGDQLEVVQQNNWEIKPDPLPLPLEMRQVYFDGYVYSVQNSMGWIHSPRWSEFFSQTTGVPAGGESIQWTRETTSLTLNLDAESINQLAAAPLEGAPSQVARKLADAGALDFTSTDYVTCVLGRVAELLQSEAGLKPANGVTALAVKIPYLAGAIQITPAGGPQSGTSTDYPLSTCAWGG